MDRAVVNGTGRGANWVERLLWPEQQSATAVQRDSTRWWLTQARVDGKITEAQARSLREDLAVAKTRADLNAVLAEIPGASAPAGLLAVRRFATAIWLGASAIQFVVWLMITLISGQVDVPWLLWAVCGGGAIVLGLWRVVALEERMRMSVAKEAAASEAAASD
jgi:hypothetical protein